MDPSDKTDPGLAPPKYVTSPTPSARQPKKKMSNGSKAAIGCGGCLVFFVLLGIIGALASTLNPHTTSTSSVSIPAPKPPKEIAMQNVSVDMKWSKGGFDAVMLADLTITNKSIYPVKDIEIKCTHYANSGTQIDSNTRTLFEIVPANSKKTFKKFNMGFINTQVARSGCEITDLQVVY